MSFDNDDLPYGTDYSGLGQPLAEMGRGRITKCYSLWKAMIDMQ